MTEPLLIRESAALRGACKAFAIKSAFSADGELFLIHIDEHGQPISYASLSADKAINMLRGLERQLMNLATNRAKGLGRDHVIVIPELKGLLRNGKGK